MEKMLTRSLSWSMDESILYLAKHIWKQMFNAEAEISHAFSVFIFIARGDQSKHRQVFKTG